MSGFQAVWGSALVIAAFLATVVGTRAYRSFALRRGILADPNFRSLHQRPTPRGGGIVFAAACIVGIAGLRLMSVIDSDLALALVGGGLVSALVGLVDDTYNLRPAWKLLAQAVLAIGIVFAAQGQPLVHIPQAPGILDLALSWLALIWLMNFYNFMDGVDAMAASGAIFFSVASVVVLSVGSTQPLATSVGLQLICALVAATSLGFLMFNRPPASIFMGDAGSLFLGFTFGLLIAKTTTNGQVSFWTWLIIFGYFAGDTTTTTIARIFVTSRWYGEHRSHAYQNLARLWASHSRVVVAVSLYHFLWLLPLAVWSTLMPATAPLAALFALLPVVLWTLRHGPLRSAS